MFPLHSAVVPGVRFAGAPLLLNFQLDGKCKMINHSNILQLCRLCLEEEKVNHSIFEETGDLRSIFLKITSCLPVSIRKDDSLPKKICETCSSKLDSFYQFWNETANAEKQLLQWLERTTLGPLSKTIPQEANKKMEDTEVKLEIDTVDNDIKGDTVEMSSEAQTYILQQQQLPYSTSTPPKILPPPIETEEPPPKRPRRASAMKALEQMESEDDDDPDYMGGNYTKSESEETDREDGEGSFPEGPSTSMDDQPGPSGIGKGSAEAPSNLVLEEIAENYDEEENYKCGVCSYIFKTQEEFFGHHISENGKKFICCKCFESFRTISELYAHSDGHKMDVEDEETEEIVLNYDGQYVTIPKQNFVESNELLYVLDDSQLVNEVVIEEQNQEPQKSEVMDAVRIVQLEHGYMLQNRPEFEESDCAEQNQCEIVHTERQHQNKKKITPSKPRARLLKRRHELPDFTSTNYMYIEPNEEIDIPHYKCLRCEQLFINKFAFFRHIEKGKCYINNCDVCTATFSTNTKFYEHYVLEHTDRAICNFCFRTFMYEKNVKEHMLRHLDQFRHRCEQCNKGFYTVREYRNHYKNRHMGIRHKCSVCSRSFADEYYFKRHIATHNSKNIILMLDVPS